MKPNVINIVPTYNERENITILLKQLSHIAQSNPHFSWSTLVVDDNSPDGTAEIVKRFKHKNMKTVLLSGVKKGLGIAMRRGIKYAITQMKADIIITNEADLAYDNTQIPTMLNQLNQGWDVVLSTRHGTGGNVEGWTINRKLNHYIANKIFAGWIAGVNHITDHNGAFRAVRVSGILDTIDWDNFPATGFGFFNYWTYILTTKTQKISQFPIVYTFRTRGESKVSFNPKYLRTYFKDVLEYIYLCFKIRRLQ